MNKMLNKQKLLSEIVSPLLNWYDHHARILPWRENTDAYRVWISEIMLQQTRVEAVKPYFERWMNALPDLQSLANATEPEVMKLWEGLGYYSRVKNIHKSAKLIMDTLNGIFPSTYEELKNLPGIGEYTAGAIGSIAFQLPIPCVDGNVLRVVTRLTAEEVDITTIPAKKLLTEWVSGIVPKGRPGDFNQAMMELGATVCLPNGQPKCEICPVAFFCEAYHQNRIAEFPNKSEKQPRKREKKTVLLVISDNNVALRKRPETGLLAGLWEFPNFPGELSEQEIKEILSASELSLISVTPLKKAKHIFTHIEWDMSGYMIIIKNQNRKLTSFVKEEGISYIDASLDFQWVDTDVLRDQLTLPSAFKAYYNILKNDVE